MSETLAQPNLLAVFPLQVKVESVAIPHHAVLQPPNTAKGG
jgi:hypothetical protein